MKSIIKNICLIICAILFITSLIVYDLCGNEYATYYDPTDKSVAAYLFIASIVAFFLWVILSLTLGEDKDDQENDLEVD